MISIYHLTHSNNFCKKLLLASLIGLCAAGYILCFYPAWQIPFAYIFAVCFFCAAAENFKSLPQFWRNILYLLPAFVIACVIVSSVVIPSLDCIQTVKNTVYPGQRFSLGGGNFLFFFLYMFHQEVIKFTNVCEISHFIGLFPLPAIISLIYLIYNKFKDKLVLGLLCVQVFIFLYLTFGFNTFLVKITMLYPVTARAVMATSFIDILLLIRLFSVNFKIADTKLKLLISSCYCFISGIGIYFIQARELNSETQFDGLNIYCIILPFVLFILSYFILTIMGEHSKKRTIFLICCIILSIFFFSRVNPLMKGIDAVYKIPAAKAIATIQKEHPGRWLVVDLFPIANFPPMMGAPTINSTNIYPNLKLWRSLDEEGKYIDCYNRYAHLPLGIFYPKDEKDKTKFKVEHFDVCMVYLSVLDLYKLDVDYIATTYYIRLKPILTNNIELTMIYDEYGFHIYKVQYKNGIKELN